MSDESNAKASWIRVIEPATALALITATLYFWGYAYLAGFCGALGFNFYGIEVPFQDYLLAGWTTLFYGLLLLAIALCLSEIAEWLGKGLDWVLRKIAKKPDLDLSVKDAPLQGPKYASGLILCVVIALIAYGGKFRVEAAKKEAAFRLSNPQPIQIYDNAHKVLEGNFIYLRDFGGALVVGEIEEGSDKPDIRVFKAGSYTSYSLKKADDPAPAEPK